MLAFFIHLKWLLDTKNQLSEMPTGFYENFFTFY